MENLPHSQKIVKGNRILISLVEFEGGDLNNSTKNNTVPKTIEKYAIDYVDTKNQKSLDKVIRWLTKYTDIDESEIDDIFIAEKPKGNKQADGTEYCLQWSIGYDGDSFQGYYYHKMRESDKWLGYSYEV